MSKVPYTWEQIESDIREALRIAAAAVDLWGTREAYYGMIGGEDGDSENIDITKHRLYSQAKRCYLYAYQLPGCEDIPEEDWDEAAMLLGGAMPVVFDGEYSPLDKDSESPLRIVLETFFARYKMNNHDGGLNIRELSHLSGMTDAVVRSSLSKEGFKLERLYGGEDGAILYNSEALRWLTKRRGFIPNKGEALEGQKKAIIEGLVFDQSMTFSEIISELSRRYSTDIYEFTQKMPDADKDWVLAFFKRDKPEIRLDLLETIAKELDAPEAMFVGRSVTHLMS